MISATSEQLDRVETNSHVLTALSEIALSSFQRLTTLSIETTRMARDDALSATSSWAHVKIDKDLKKMPTPFGGEAMSKFVAYMSDVQGILGDAQAEFNRVMAPYLPQSGKGGSALAGWNSGVDLFKKVGRQTSSLVNANIAKSGEIADKLIDGKLKEAGELAKDQFEGNLKKGSEQFEGNLKKGAEQFEGNLKKGTEQFEGNFKKGAEQVEGNLKKGAEQFEGNFKKGAEMAQEQFDSNLKKGAELADKMVSSTKKST